MHLHYATFWKRIAAHVVDVFLLTALSFIAGMLVSVVVVDYATERVSNGIGLLLGFLYFAGFWSTSGATPGKKAFHLKVVGHDNKVIGVTRAAVRFIGYFLSAVTLLLGFVWILFDPRGQGWHDRVAGTFVVEDENP